MKIAICGTHGVGKTTLAEDLLEHLPGHELVIEPYYEMEASGNIFSEIPGVDDFVDQFHHSVKRIANSGEYVIFDRCPVDILAYIHSIEPQRNIQQLFQTAQIAMEQIDLLVFVPIEYPDFYPGGEPELTELRLSVNDVLQDWVWDFNTNIIAVKGDVRTRREQVLALNS